MKSIKTITALAILAFMVLATSSAFAADLTVGTEIGAEGETTVYVPITVDNPIGIAGAAFTLEYDTSALTVMVDSTFFDTFAMQWAALDPAPDPLPPTTVEVDGISYDQPLITNEITGTGMRIAAACCKPADGSNTTLFTLTFTLNQGAQPINYPITVVQTVLDNTDAGYDAGGETIPMLVGADASKDVTDPDAFPILLDPAAAPPIGTTESGSVNFDTDGDAIVDNWEIAYFGNLTTATATSDFDEDGYSDKQEYDNDTHPKLQNDDEALPGFNSAAKVSVPRVIQVQLDTPVSTGHYVTVFDKYGSGNGVWIDQGQNSGDSTTDPLAPAGAGGAGLIAAPANMFGVSTGYGHLLLSVAADESIVTELEAIGDNTPTNANPDIFGGATGPANKNNIELDRAIPEGTEVTFTVDMNNEIPHLVAVMGGTAPAVTYDDSGTGTLTIQTTTFGTITNAGDTFSSIVGFMIFTDESLGTDALRIIAQTNHWVGDIFPLLPGWDTNAVVGGGTQGTVTARCGTTIVGPTGDQRDIKIFFPDDSIASIFGNDVFNDELAAFVDSDEQPGATITLDVANFDTTGTLAEFTYTFGSKRDTSIGVSGGESVSATRSHSGYYCSPDSAFEIAVQISYEGTLSAVGIEETIPAGWTFKSAGGDDAPGIKPAQGATGSLEFAWIPPLPSSPIDFTYTVQIPADADGEKAFSGQVLYRRLGGELIAPIAGTTVQKKCFHTGDYNPADWSINLSELLRIIQLYSVGSFHCDAQGEDGYGLGDGDETCTPHDLDYNPLDWSFSLSELLRLIQIYSIGSYHVDPNGEDGFGLGNE